MKVYENIARFHQGSNGKSFVVVSDEEMREGLKSIIDAVVPYRKEKDIIIPQYLAVRDELPLTSSLAEGPFGPSPEQGKQAVDFAMLKLIYEDRYSFGHLYWYLLSQFEKNDAYEYFDSDAPFKQGLIEYAVDFDLENTVEVFHGFSSPDERLEYAISMLRKSRLQVLIDHPIKNEFESKLSILEEDCRAELSAVDLALLESDTNKDVGISAPEEENKTSTGSSRHSIFANRYVRDANNRDKLMSYLHEQLRDKKGQHALVFIQAAINAKLLSAPSYSDLIDEFGPVCGHSSYYKLVKAVGGGEFKRLPQDVEALAKELKDHFK